MAHIKHITLAADDPTTVDLGADVRRIEILNRDGAGEVYYRVDPGQGFTFDLEDDDIDVLPACINSEVKVSRGSGNTKVLLRATAETKVTIREADLDV